MSLFRSLIPTPSLSVAAAHDSVGQDQMIKEALALGKQLGYGIPTRHTPVSVLYPRRCCEKYRDSAAYP